MCGALVLFMSRLCSLARQIARVLDLCAAQVYDIMRPDASMSRRAPPPASLRLFLTPAAPPGWAGAAAADAGTGGVPAVYAVRSQGAFAFYMLRRTRLASLWEPIAPAA